MTSSAATFLMVVALGAVIVLIASAVWGAGRKRQHRRHLRDDEVREAARRERLRLQRQDALAYQAAAKARAVQDRAEVQARAAGPHHQPPPTAAMTTPTQPTAGLVADPRGR